MRARFVIADGGLSVFEARFSVAAAALALAAAAVSAPRVLLIARQAVRASSPSAYRAAPRAHHLASHLPASRLELRVALLALLSVHRLVLFARASEQARGLLLSLAQAPPRAPSARAQVGRGTYARRGGVETSVMAVVRLIDHRSTSGGFFVAGFFACRGGCCAPRSGDCGPQTRRLAA